MLRLATFLLALWALGAPVALAAPAVGNGSAAQTTDQYGQVTLSGGSGTVVFATPYIATAPPLCLVTVQLTSVSSRPSSDYGCFVSGSAGNWTGLTINSSSTGDTATVTWRSVGNPN